MSQEDAPKQDGPEPTPAKPEEPKGTTGFDALPPETQAEIKQLRSEAAKYRTEAQEAKGKLSEREEAEKSDLEKAQSKAAKLEKEKADAVAALTRFQVAAEKQVPAEAVDLLQGASREELEASADKLLSLVKKPDTTEQKPDFDGGAREPAPEPETPEQAHNKAVLEVLGLRSS